MPIIVTRHTSPTGFYGRNRHRNRALHVSGGTANSRPVLPFHEQSRPSHGTRSLSSRQPTVLGIEFTRNQSMFPDRAFHSRSGFPVAVHTYSPSHEHEPRAEMLTQRERERGREGETEREVGQTGSLHLRERVVVHKDSFRPLSSLVPTPSLTPSIT